MDFEDAMVLIVFGIIAVIGLIIALMWAIATEFKQIAADKGYKDEKYFWWTFWLPMVGISMIIAMPDRKGTERR